MIFGQWNPIPPPPEMRERLHKLAEKYDQHAAHLEKIRDAYPSSTLFYQLYHLEASLLRLKSAIARGAI